MNKHDEDGARSKRIGYLFLSLSLVRVIGRYNVALGGAATDRSKSESLANRAIHLAGQSTSPGAKIKYLPLAGAIVGISNGDESIQVSSDNNCRSSLGRKRRSKQVGWPTANPTTWLNRLADHRSKSSSTSFALAPANLDSNNNSVAHFT